MNLESEVKICEIVESIAREFDYSFDGTSSFEVPSFDIPKSYSIGLIVGNSGSGKTSALNQIGSTKAPKWDKARAVCSHFLDSDDAKERLCAAGLSSVPSWVKPYHVLSNGEKFRADLARVVDSGAIIDEFTSVVDRDVAKSASASISRYIRRKGMRNIVFASCHKDIIDWLSPDWVYDCDERKIDNKRRLERPEIKIKVEPCSYKEWSKFSDHHYLDGNINKSARCWLAKWRGRPVGFAACIAFPSGTIRNAWRGHRTVILPEFQGLGIGVRLSDAVAKIMTLEGKRYFSKTSHFRMGEYRERSPLWRPTSKNKKLRKDYASKRKTKEDGHKMRHVNRVCYSHEYIGE